MNDLSSLPGADLLDKGLHVLGGARQHHFPAVDPPALR
jgi:hypothetical protein